MFLNHARPPWAGLGTWSECHGEPLLGAGAPELLLGGRGLKAGQAAPLAPGSTQAPPPAAVSLLLQSLPELHQPTFAVKFDGGALCRTGSPRTDVDGTTLQHSRLAGVGLGCSHQHTDPGEGKGKAV